jgi:lysophospholipase L1-like esterase
MFDAAFMIRTRPELLRSSLRRFLIGTCSLMACACGGPTEPPPPDLHTLQAIVFYDENGDGRMGPEERVRVPQVELSCAGKTGTSVRGTGQVTIEGVPAGAQNLYGVISSFPPFFESPPGGVPIDVPYAGEVPFPLQLPIGGANRHTYMAFGDSITEGDGSSDYGGYRQTLRNLLENYWGVDSIVINRGIAGQKSFRGVERIASDLSRSDPAYTLILYGTNDWNDLECRHSFPCYTIDNLRTIIRTVRDYQSLPVIGTIPPAAPNWNPPERNDWIVSMNDLIRPMAVAEGAVVAEIHAGFPDEPELQDLFADHVHPNDEGYKIIARAFFNAIVMPRSQANSSPSSFKGFSWIRWSSRPQPSPGPFY